jgi:dethiobiotin synthetase
MVLREPSAPPAVGCPFLGLFFTGTDTGVGKTFVTCLVARQVRSSGRAVRVCKPVATGADLVQGRWLSDDTRRLAEAAGLPGEWERITPWSFPEPVAPPVAARCQGVRLDLAEIVAAVRRCAEPGVPLLVEGVGGLLCPLTDSATVADLAAQLRLPLVVVARRSLGTLNHTLLTLEVARHRGLTVAGVVVNEVTPAQGLAEATNVAELRQHTAVPILAVVPHRAGPLGEPCPEIAALDWWGLSQNEATACRP